MPTRSRFIPLAAITVCSALLAACVATPDDVAQLDANRALDQRSSRGLVEATVALDNPQLARGPNDFSIALRAAKGASSPVLTSVDASMVVHGHHASASNILSDGEIFRAVGLDLFMSGRWQIALGVELDDTSDLVEFALDVP
ncbi:MAG TPA: hypothetical protein VJV79_08960 [Polyangiaceae bacterium]|nr:hypothetical protein [Polyangiaceae bacterium]